MTCPIQVTNNSDLYIFLLLFAGCIFVYRIECDSSSIEVDNVTALQTEVSIWCNFVAEIIKGSTYGLSVFRGMLIASSNGKVCV